MKRIRTIRLSIHKRGISSLLKSSCVRERDLFSKELALYNRLRHAPGRGRCIESLALQGLVTCCLSQPVAVIPFRFLETWTGSCVGTTGYRKIDIRLPGNGNSNSHGARPVHRIILMIKWTRISRLSMKNTLSLHQVMAEVTHQTSRSRSEALPGRCGQPPNPQTATLNSKPQYK